MYTITFVTLTKLLCNILYEYKHFVHFNKAKNIQVQKVLYEYTKDFVHMYKIVLYA